MTIIPITLAGFSSASAGQNTLFATSLPPQERVWSSASRRPQTLAFQFNGVYMVERITADILSTDQTSDAFWYGFFLRGEDGGYSPHPVHEASNVNIGRGGKDEFGFSLDLKTDAHRPLKEGWVAARDSHPRLDVALSTPVRAIGGMLCLRGHGWFYAQSVVFHGTKVAALPETAEADFLEDISTDLKAIWKA